MLFLRNGSVLSHLDGEGMRAMEIQQEIASKHAFKESLLKQAAINTGSNVSDLRNQHEADLRTERVTQALDTNAQFGHIPQSDHEMESVHSLPPGVETEIRDDTSIRTIPRSETTYLPSLNRSQSMSDVAHQSSAVADLTNEIERQRQIAEYELQQQELRQTRQLEIVRQEAAFELHSTTQSLTESHRNEATTAIAYVTNSTENALNRLNKQSQELQQMAENGERLDARARQMITARKNQLRNQAKEQESPERAKPKAKSEPFKFTSTAVKDDEVKDGSDDGSPETKHEPKGKRGRPKRTIETKKNQHPDHDTEKDENRTGTHWRKAKRIYLVDQLSKNGWRQPTTPDGKMQNLRKQSIGTNCDRPT